MRKTQFINGEYYHVYNRGVDKRDVFLDNYDFIRFIRSIREFNNVDPVGSLYLKNFRDGCDKGVKHPIGCLTPKPLVEFIVYCLNPNHYHFILKQLVEGGITEFMKRLNGGYTNYFNKKYNRSGSLFGGPFKSIHIKSNKYLLWLSGYVNGNIEIHQIAKAEKYQWSSYFDYLYKRNSTICNKEIILDQFKNEEEYEEFVNGVIKDSRERKDEIKKYSLE